MVAWPPSTNNTTNIRGTLPTTMAQMPKAITTISATLQAIITLRLLKRSAKKPAGAAKIRKGSVKHASPSDNARLSGSTQFLMIGGMWAQPCGINSLPMGTTSQRNMLSFNDTKNWVATSDRKESENTPPRPSSVAGGVGMATVANVPLMPESSGLIDMILGLRSWVLGLRSWAQLRPKSKDQRRHAGCHQFASGTIQGGFSRQMQRSDQYFQIKSRL